jgi:RimJ/RimL family protein N-acetyltransferase
VVRLQPMSDAEFRLLLDGSIPRYAEEHVRAGQWSPEEALERSREEHARLLPEGLRTHDHFLVTLRAGTPETRVGELWYTVRREGLVTALWVYWIGIDPAHRRKGYATETLRALEDEARRFGADRLQLHVFGANAPARSAYRAAGFEESNVIMTKRLRPGTGGTPAPRPE